MVGWYLTVLPTPYKGSDPLEILVVLDAPFSKWFLSKSFDTAKECERERNRRYIDTKQVEIDLRDS
jgi:hypothetical protein